MRIACVVAVAVVCGSNAGCEAPIAQKTAALTSLFSDGFESSPTAWGMFEEIVGGNHCYDDGIGSVAQTSEQHDGGSGSLRVFANASSSNFSNHVIAQRRLSTTGVDTELTYSLSTMVDPAAGDGFHEGQTGPELSVQRTRLEGSVWRTRTAGIQYVANKWSGQGTWQIWSDTGSGSAGWVSFAQTSALTPGEWATITLVFDYSTNAYVSISVDGAGASMSQSLSSYTIIGEAKFSEDALWLTLEAENVWSGCGGAYEYRVYYDDVSLAD